MDPSSSQSEPLPMQFEGSSGVLPLTKQGLATFSEFKKAEEGLNHMEWLKRIGLTDEEIQLYKENEAGFVEQRPIESSVLRTKLNDIYNKIRCKTTVECFESPNNEEQPSTSTAPEKVHTAPTIMYPEGHPMNEIKDLEHKLFGQLKQDEQNMLPINKRRKLLRRLERKEERLRADNMHEPLPTNSKNDDSQRPDSLWDVKEMPQKRKLVENKESAQRETMIGPKKPTMYTVKDHKIVRLEPLAKDNVSGDNYQAVDIVVPVNAAEERLLEGTKMCLDDIKKIERFKDYEPGIPSKVLYLKNIASSVGQEQLQLLFLQFVQENGGPIDVRLMSGRMRGQAFVAFENEDVAIQALEEVNGTIVGGRPIIAQFGRNSNRIQTGEDNR